jgi:capsid portal protein
METNIWQWLIQQAPVIVVMGVVIYWLAQRLVKAEDQKDLLSKDVVKLTTIWEEKYAKDSDKDNEKSNEVIKLLGEIKQIVSSK